MEKNNKNHNNNINNNYNKTNLTKSGFDIIVVISLVDISFHFEFGLPHVVHFTCRDCRTVPTFRHFQNKYNIYLTSGSMSSSLGTSNHAEFAEALVVERDNELEENLNEPLFPRSLSR